MIPTMKYLCLVLILLLGFAAFACSDSDDSDDSGSSFFALSGGESEAAAAPTLSRVAMLDSADFDATEEAMEAEASVVRVESQSAPAAPAAASAKMLAGDAVAQDDGGESLPDQGVATLVQQRRIIVRTVDMGIEVGDVGESIDEIGGLAEEMGGWLVSSSHAEEHFGFVSVRVPAERLEEAIQRLRGMAQDVRSEITSSRDVTDEYYDIQARLTNLEATEGALIKLLDRAEKVEDALSIQQSLSEVQEDIERLQGRIKLLEQTAAYSLINVSLELVKGEMSIEAGEDKSTAVDEPVRFRATFTPPLDIEEFTFTWDFGDGSQPISSNRTAPTEDESKRVTATITHVYADERDSPYIAQIKISGFGEAGEFEGEDTVIVTVSRAPVIEVFAGDHFSIEAGETVQFSGSFTRPSEIRGVTYVWDFGDGTEPESGSVGEGVTTVVASHTYPNHRPYPYEVRLTIMAQSDAGPVEKSSVVTVFVDEPLGWTIAGWDGGDQIKGAVRSLSAVVLGLTTLGIWFVIFAPVWVVVIVVVVLVRRRRARNPQRPDPEPELEEEPDSEESEG
ncbi:MAG: DUF4349 domain-containing protein [Chloroflexi bacterium]|nr:DUF4349 domain-containing protein [Chloroflexota bacterium]